MNIDIKNHRDIVLLGAFRGPDAINCVGLKLVFTARIRALMGLPINEWVAVRVSSALHHILDPDILIDEVNRAGVHYLDHIQDALFVLEKDMNTTEYYLLSHLLATLKSACHFVKFSKEYDRSRTQVAHYLDALVTL